MLLALRKIFELFPESGFHGRPPLFHQFRSAALQVSVVRPLVFLQLTSPCPVFSVKPPVGWPQWFLARVWPSELRCG